MKNPAQKIKASTQKFTEIEDIIENIVLLANGNACLVIEVKAVNFPFLSQEEQYTKMYSYASLLNSLSFSIQILVRNKKIDISSYIKLLEGEIAKTKNPVFVEKIKLYKEFIESMVKVNSVLDKKFYIVIPYSPYETVSIKRSLSGKNQKQTMFNYAKAALKLKEDSLLSQLNKMGLHTKTLNKDELIKLFHSIYNDDGCQAIHEPSAAQSPFVKTKM